MEEEFQYYNSFHENRLERIESGYATIDLFTNDMLRYEGNVDPGRGKTYLVLHTIPVPCPGLLDHPLEHSEAEYTMGQLKTFDLPCLEGSGGTTINTFDGLLHCNKYSYVLTYYTGVVEWVSTGLFLIGRQNNTVPILSPSVIRSSVTQTIHMYMRSMQSAAKNHKVLLLMTIIGSEFCYIRKERGGYSADRIRPRNLPFPSFLVDSGNLDQIDSLLELWWQRLENMETWKPLRY